MPRTALIVVVPEAEPAVGPLRAQYDWSAQHGVPAHITVLFPFAPPDEVDEAALAELFARHRAFDFELASVETFPGSTTTYLAPVPAEPFRLLTAAVWERWPDYPPYEGIHDTVVPHLTVSDEAPVTIDAGLPIRAHAEAVTLIEEDADGQWAERARFQLAPPR